MFCERGYENVKNDLVPQFTFSEGKLDNIDLEDLLCLVQNMKTWVLRFPDNVNDMDALKRYLKHAINLANLEDYQQGIESKLENINVLPPDLSHPTIDQIPLYTSHIRPEMGVCYLNLRGNQRFMRMS